MTVDILGVRPQNFPATKALGEAVSAWLRAHHPQLTVKELGAKINCDRKTAENIVAGHLSSTSIAKLMRAYGWPLLSAVGAEVIGETYETSINRELEAVTNERHELDAREERLRESYARLKARRSVDGAGLRLHHPEDRQPPREDRSFR